MSARMAVVLPALVAVMGCGRIVGIHDFSPADAGSNADGSRVDVVRDLPMNGEVFDSRTSPDSNDADAVTGMDASVDKDIDLAVATNTAFPTIDAIDSAGAETGDLGQDGPSDDAAPDGKACPSRSWQWATTSILANSGGGACNFASGTLPVFVAAIDDPDFDQTRGCGICLRLVPGRTDVVTKYVDVLVVDSAGSGNPGRQLNISRQAMDAIAPPGTQNLGLNFAVVPCSPPLISTTIHMTEQHASNPQHVAVQVRDLAFALSSLEVWFAGSWNAMTFAPYNYWIFDSAGITPPYSFRLTSNLGDTLVVDEVTLLSTSTDDGPLVDTQAQFPGCVP